MKPTRTLSAVLVLAALAGASTARAQSAEPNPFARLKFYDFQARQPVQAIQDLIQKALVAHAPTVTIETGLIDVIQDPQATFAGKQEAARFLWMIGTARSVPALAKLLPDEKLSNVARYALERNSDPTAAAALRAALKTLTGVQRIGVINSLGDRADPLAVQVLKPFVVSSDQALAEAAITAIGKIGTPSAIAVLKTLPLNSVNAGEAMVRASERMIAGPNRALAQTMLVSLAGPGRPTFVRSAALRALSMASAPQTNRILLEEMKGPDTYLQQVAAKIAGSRGDSALIALIRLNWAALAPMPQSVLLTQFAARRLPDASPLALLSLKSPDPAVRSAAMVACGHLMAAQAVQPLLDIAAHGDGRDRDSAREVLSNLPGPAAESAIITAGAAGSAEVKREVIRVAVGRGTPASTAWLMATANGSDAGLAAEALRGLERTAGPNEYAALVKLLTGATADEVRDASRQAVVSVGGRMGRDSAAAPLLAAYQGAQGASKIALLLALGELGGDQALAVLTAAAAGDGELRAAAVQSLAETWPDSRAMPTLLTVATSATDKSLRVQALRGYIRHIDQDDQLATVEKVKRLSEAMKRAERPEEKRQALAALRNCRVPEAMELAAAQLDNPEIFSDAAGTVIYLAAKRRKDNRDQPAVTGPAATAALDRVIELTKDDSQKAEAQGLK